VVITSLSRPGLNAQTFLQLIVGVHAYPLGSLDPHNVPAMDRDKHLSVLQASQGLDNKSQDFRIMRQLFHIVRHERVLSILATPSQKA
jgi:hypothetical protein